MADIFNMLDTWNAAGTTFTGIKLNVTDTASAAGSLLMDLQVGGVSQFKVQKNGATTFSNGAILSSAAGLDLATNSISRSGAIAFGASSDVALHRDAANTLAQRNGVNAQAFNLYQSYTDASNYERARTGWNANVFEVFSEAAGTGTRRNLSIYAAQTIIDGPADSSYSLRRNGVAQIFAGSAGPRFAQPMYPGSAIVDIGLSSFPFRDIFLKPSASLTPNANGDLCIEATNNTTLTFKLKGSDGTVRSGTVTLA